MRELSEIYKAITNRIEILKKKGVPPQRIETVLRLDIENCIDLISDEQDVKLFKNS